MFYLVKPFAYFIAITAVCQFYFSPSITLVAAAAIAIAASLIEALSINLTPQIWIVQKIAAGRRVDARLVAEVFVPAYLASVALSWAVAMIVIFALSQDLYRDSFAGWWDTGYYRTTWHAAAVIFIMIAALQAISFAISSWAVSVKLRSDPF